MEEIIRLLIQGGGWSTTAAIGVTVMVFEELIDRVWDLSGVASQIRTLCIGAVLGLAGAVFGIGMFTDPAVCATNIPALCGLLVGVSAAIAANFAFLLPISKSILEALKIRPKE